MKLFRVRRRTDGRISFATRVGDRFVGAGAPFSTMGFSADDGRARDDPFDAAAGDVDVLAPVSPSKIVCIGRNYAAHAKELGNDVPDEPTLFLKPPSSIVADGGVIERPTHMSSLVHHEGELAVVIGKTARFVDEDHALDHVCGYTIGNDVTARDVQRKDVQFTRGKGFDTFCPLGPHIVTVDEAPAHDAFAVEVRVNGAVKQSGHTRDMVFSVPFLVAYVSRVMTLLPGDVILTGTPEGVGPLVAGDVVEVEISGLGVLRNTVVDVERPADARQ